MIKDNLTFELGKLKVEVNWSPEVIPCQKIKITFDGKEEIVDRGDFYSMLMIFGDDKQQEDLIPVTRTEMIRVERLLHVKATKNIKRGEYITVPYRYSLSKEAYDQAMRENPRSFKRLDGELSTAEPTEVEKQPEQV